MTTTLAHLVQSGRNAWDAAACKGQRLPVLHQMQHEVRRHKSVEAAAQAIVRGEDAGKGL